MVYNIRYTVTYFPWSPELALLLNPPGAFVRPQTAAHFGSYYFSILKVGISVVPTSVKYKVEHDELYLPL